jgi:glyceraldehyde 3-phosphate dehydrogenase
MAKIAINGLGRIGRQVFKVIFDNFPELEIVAANDLFPNDQLGFLLKYDSNYGTWHREVKVDSVEDGFITVDGKKILMFAERDPSKLPWKDLDIDIVVEATGVFRTREKAMMHINAGAKKVIITAPAKDEDITVVLGVNEKLLDPAKHTIISMASCTTNSIAPVAKVLQEKIGFKTAYLTTIHSYTVDQKLLDSPHKDLRRARSAAMNIVPTTTGAAKAVALVIPELKGKIGGMALRVPTPTVSISILDAVMNRETTVQEINDMLKEAHETYMKGILGYSEEPLVSMDYKGSTYSGIVDALSTQVINGNFIHIVSWYDNEWGYSVRVGDLIKLLSDKAGF